MSERAELIGAEPAPSAEWPAILLSPPLISEVERKLLSNTIALPQHAGSPVS